MPDGLEDAIEFCLLNDSLVWDEVGALLSLAGVIPDTVFPVTPVLVEMVLPLVPTNVAGVIPGVLILRVLRLEEDR